MPTLLPLTALFSRVAQAHPNSDLPFSRNRARRSSQSALPAPVGQLPTALPARRARWATAAGLYPRHGQLRRRGERPDRLDMPGQRACLPSLALGRDIPPRRDYCAGPGEDGRHASAWSWDHAMVRARWFRGPRR